MKRIKKVLNKKLKLPSIIGISLFFGLVFWVADSLINSYFKVSKSLDVAWDTFIGDLQSTPDIYSRLVAIVLLVVLGLISFMNRRMIAFQNEKLNMMKNELENTNKKLREFLFKDYLTGTINRKPFIGMLNRKIRDSKNKKFAILFIDLAKFKSINDNFGHDFGDKVLIHASSKLSEGIGKKDFIGRYGGDEFIICIDEFDTKNDIIEIVNNILNALGDKVEIEDKQINLKLDIGIALYPEDGKTMHDLIRNSDNAMYKAKKNGTPYEFYS